MLVDAMLVDASGCRVVNLEVCIYVEVIWVQHRVSP